MTFKVQKTENSGIVYADPSDPDLTVRVKHTSSVKTLGQSQVQNQVTEVVVGDLHSITVGGNTSADALSIRLRVSGSTQSHARKKALLQALNETMDVWVTEDVLQGFNPTTVPVSPT